MNNPAVDVLRRCLWSQAEERGRLAGFEWGLTYVRWELPDTNCVCAQTICAEIDLEKLYILMRNHQG